MVGFVFAGPFLKHCMLRFISFSLLASSFLWQSFSQVNIKRTYNPISVTMLNSDSEKLPQDLFDSLTLGRLGLARRAYDYAMLGYKVLKAKGLLSNDEIISIADMTLPSNKKRFFVFDVKKYKLLFVTYVAHGKNSGL